MTLPSRLTLLLTFGATLLVVIPIARVSAEQNYCEGLRQARPPNQTATKPDDEVAFDPCTMWDFGMANAVRWSVYSGMFVLIIAAASYGRDRWQAKRQ